MVQSNPTFFLRSPRTASRAFGTGSPGQPMSAVPRTKFEFYVQFVLSSGANSMLANANLNTYEGNRGLTFKVKTADKPKINLVTEDLNQYNKKVIAYKKIEYQETSISLYDTVDNSPLATWVDYFTYYFADSRRHWSNSQSDYLQSPVESKFNLGAGWGFLPLLDAQTNFFDAIAVYALFGNTYTAFRYINPKITSIDWGSRDYSSSDPEDVNISFKYEAIDYFAFAQPFSGSNPTPDGVMPNFGFDNALDDINYPVGTQTMQIAAIPRLFGINAAQTQSMANAAQQVPVVPSNNVSNPNNTITPEASASAAAAAASAASASISSAPGASAPIPVAVNSSLSTTVNYGTGSPVIVTTNTFASQTITQQIGQQSGQIAITSVGGGRQYTNTLTGQPLNLPPVSSTLLNNPIQSGNPAISAQALALAQGYYGPSVPQSLVQSIASVAAYMAATQGIPIGSLLSPNGVSDTFINAYNKLSPPGSSIGIVAVQPPLWPSNPALRGSLAAAFTDPA
jgi:hypothetical protein